MNYRWLLLILISLSSVMGLSQEEIKPAMSTVQAEQQADALRLQTIATIQKMLSSKMRDHQKFELYLRLGDLYSERHDYLRGVEIKSYEMSHDRWLKNKKKSKEPILKHTKSKGELTKAANIFYKVVKDFPGHPRGDVAMFSLARTLQSLENEKYIDFYKKIITLYKQSDFLPQSYLALGEFYFEKQIFSKSESYYKQVLKYKSSSLYTYAVYKLGWSYFNQSSGLNDNKIAVQKAIAAFKIVVKRSGMNNKKSNMKQEAINDLIMVFAEYQMTNEALAYFQNIGEPEAFYNVLERMGNLYVEQGEKEKAIKVFTRLLKESPTRENNFQVHLTLTHVYDSQNNHPMVVQNLAKMNRLYVAKSPWTIKNHHNKDLVNNAREETRKTMHRYGALYHKKGIDDKNLEYMRSAKNLYTMYLQSFPSASDAIQIRFYLAEILFKFKEYDKAASQYYLVSLANTKNKKRAAIASVESMQKIDESQKYGNLPPLGKVSKSLKLPPVKVKYIKMMDNFIGLFPDDKLGNPMRYTSAYTFFQYGHYTESLKRLENIVSVAPKSKQGLASVNLILGYYTEKKQWSSLIAVCRKLLKNPNMVDSKIKTKLHDTLRHSLFGVALRYAEEKKYKKSAKSFIAYQEEFPNASDAHDALYNATLNYYRSGEIENAIANAKVYLKLYGEKSHARNVTKDIAQSQEALANFKEAAKYFDLYARRYPKDKFSKLSLYNAATLYKGLKEYQKSISLYHAYIARYPSDRLAPSVILEIANLSEIEKKYKDSVKYYLLYAKKIRSKSQEKFLFAQAKSARIIEKHLSPVEGRKHINQVFKILTNKGSPVAYEARHIIAESMFENLEVEFLNFKKIHITSAQSLEKDIRRKQSELKILAKKYENIVKVASGEYTVASLYRVAEMNDDLAAKLLKAPSPVGASQLEIDQYRSSIEKVVFPLKEESEKYYELAYQRSREVQTFTNWTRIVRSKMTQINESKYPSINEKSVQADYLSHKLIWQKEIASLAE